MKQKHKLKPIISSVGMEYNGVFTIGFIIGHKTRDLGEEIPQLAGTTVKQNVYCEVLHIHLN